MALPFPQIGTSVAPDPTQFWHPSIKAPYPTNVPWMNLVLNGGTNPYLATPYLIKSEFNKLSFGFPNKACQAAFIFQVFVTDLILEVKEELGRHQVVEYDDLSVTLAWNSKLRVPLVAGSPYITFIFQNSTPKISSIHAILGFTSNSDFTKHSITLNNGQKWVVYCSSPLQFHADLSSMSTTSTYSGTIRIALVPQFKNQGPSAESALDLHRSVYPVGGSATVKEFEIVYEWKTQSWRSHNPDPNIPSLIMLSKSVHRKSILPHLKREISDLCYPTLDGLGVAQLGDKWHLKLPPISITWHSTKGIQNPHERADLSNAVKNDVASMTPITTPSTYFHGKQLARIARLGLIAEEIDLANEVSQVKHFLKSGLSAWYDGTFQGNSLVYDTRWGGIVSTHGAKDQGADFGLAVYNDHHFHFGYFIYASAVLAKLDSDWRRKYKSKVDFLVNDYMSHVKSAHFPRFRNFDFYSLHSWASGLCEFGDGPNQESTSEAVNAYYAASLLGLASGDLSLASTAATLMAFESLTSKVLWHVWDDLWNDSPLYEPPFLQENALVGVLWATKRDANLWFASSRCRTMCLGIQVLPIEPVTELLLSDTEVARRLDAWAMARPEQTTDAWNGFVFAVRAVWDRPGAIHAIKSLQGFDDGNSLSNLLWWAYSR